MLSHLEIVTHCELLQMKFVPKPSWKKASIDQTECFKTSVSEKLLLMQVPTEVIDCSDVKCRNIDHVHLIDNYLDNVLHAFNDAAYECLPISTQNVSISKKKGKLLLAGILTLSLLKICLYFGQLFGKVRASP